MSGAASASPDEKTCARAFPSSGEARTAREFEERRVGDDRLGLIVGEPRLPTGARVADVDRQDSNPPRQSVPRGVGGGELSEARVDLDEIAGEALRCR